MRQVIGELQSLIDDGEQGAHDLRQFLKSVRKYTGPEKLIAEMLNELVDKIIVHAPDKSSGHRRQKIEIYYKAAGIIDIADDLCEAGTAGGNGAKSEKRPETGRTVTFYSHSPAVHKYFVAVPD